MPQVRPSLRRPPQSILGENTPPPSATMLALQTIAARDPETSLANVTNGSTALVRSPQTFDGISNQILSLTSIATSLQKEMANLSRRSKDNATDLVSLKEATNSRDEDIRKSLRELVVNLSESASRSSSNNTYDRGLLLDNRPHGHQTPPPRKAMPFALPRIPSPNSFAASLDRESMASPGSFMHEGGATIALLEKILREMGTREGDELLVARLTEIADTVAQHNSATASKLDELLQHVKNTSTSRDLAPLNGNGSGGNRTRHFTPDEAPRLELEFDQPRVGPMTQRVGALLASNGNKENMRESISSRSTDVLSEDILKIVRSVKDSVAHSGGLTAEVKALVRDLRAEVLVMGRELGRKLDEAEKSPSSAGERSDDNVAQIVQDGLDDLKDQMDNIIRENRRQSAGSTSSRTTVDYQEIFNAMRAALRERDQQHGNTNVNKDEIIDAVKSAWENYKPEIEIQQFGLERDELLACLKEGMAQYSARDQQRDLSATRDEVYDAVMEGLKHFSPPKVESEASLSRDEILDAVRECLEEFEFPSAPPQEPLGPEFTRDDVLGAVREGLQTFDFPANMEAQRGQLDDALRDEILEAVDEGLRAFDFSSVLPTSKGTGDVLSRVDILDAVKEALESADNATHSRSTTALALPSGSTLTRDDVFDAVQAGLRENPSAANGADPRVMDSLHDIIDTLQTEFRAVSMKQSRMLLRMEEILSKFWMQQKMGSTACVPIWSTMWTKQLEYLPRTSFWMLSRRISTLFVLRLSCHCQRDPRALLMMLRVSSSIFERLWLPLWSVKVAAPMTRKRFWMR
jgi:hypothetical protein